MRCGLAVCTRSVASSANSAAQATAMLSRHHRPSVQRDFSSGPLAGPATGAQQGGSANSYISMGSFETMGTDVGRAATGLAYLEETVRVLEALYAKEEDPRRRSSRALTLAASMLQAGRQHHVQQDPKEAIRQYERAIALVDEAIEYREKEEEASEDETTTSISSRARAIKYATFMNSELLCGLGVAHNDTGEQDTALEKMKASLKLRKETVGAAHPSLAECMNNLGAIYSSRGSFQKAVENYEQALELLTAASGGKQEGPHIALTMYNIGLCRRGLAQLPQAVAALQRAETIGKNSLGDDHPQVAMIRKTLADFSQSPGMAKSE